MSVSSMCVKSAPAMTMSLSYQMLMAPMVPAPGLPDTSMITVQNPMMNPYMMTQPMVPQVPKVPQMPRSIPPAQVASASQMEFFKNFLRGPRIPENELQGSYAELTGIAPNRMGGNR